MIRIPLLRQSLRLMRRELRNGLRGFGVFVSCLCLGVFAISAIGSFTASAKSGLLADAGALLGGDLEVRVVHRQLRPDQTDYLRRLGALSHVSTMRTMASDEQRQNRLLIELKSIDRAYPLYGELVTEPALTLDEAFGTELGALVEEACLVRLGVRVGDRIQIGRGSFLIRGILRREPDRTVRAFTLGPRVMISKRGLSETGLIQPGSLVNHAYRLRLPDRAEVERIKEELNSTFPEAGWRIRTWQDATPRVRFFLDRMNQNLTLVGLCALLVGGLGVSSAVRGYLGGKVVHIATMKCLGAPGSVIFTTYLLQILVLGACGSVIGLAGGGMLPFLIDWAIGDRLPFPLVPAIHPPVLITAALFGLLIALAFSLKTLGIARHVSPAILFRGYGDLSKGSPGTDIRLAIILSAIGLATLVIMISSDKRLALWFVAGAACCFALFRVAAAWIIQVSKRLPRPRNPSLRLGLANIHRRGSPAGSALFSLGLGLTALVIVVLVQANLDDRVTQTIPSEAPAFFFLDIQNHQAPAFDRLINRSGNVTKAERYPTLRGRITAIGGIPVEQADVAPDVQWAIRGDRYLSYAAKEPEGTTLKDGAWWPADYSGPPKVSLTADLAEGFGVDIGETLTLNVLGREITAEIASTREVDWSTLDLNFAILLAPGVLEGAPQTHIASAHLPVDDDEALYRAVTEEFPNVTVISTREVLQNVSRTLERIGTAFRAMAAIALLTGFLVLAGAVSADQHRRIHDAVIFKVCGATRMDILLAFASEFLLIGLAGGLISSAIGSLAAMGILQGLMKTEFSLHGSSILGTIAVGILLTMTLGLLGTWKALGQKPGSLLRAE